MKCPIDLNELDRIVYKSYNNDIIQYFETEKNTYLEYLSNLIKIEVK